MTGQASPGHPRGGSSTSRVTLAAIAGAHGVRGELRLKLFGESPDTLAAQKQVLVGGRPFELASLKDGGKVAIARLAGVTDRDSAEALRGQLVEIERGALPPLEDGEYYHADLVGLPCVDPSGEPVGTVVAVENFGAGDLLDVELAGGRTSLIPFRDGIADLAGDRIVVDREFLA
ncbi:16S rRNA processing protein RimM [Sphingomonas ginkgonis]|uniref:Ribosome maturation factor RimM n=1 Tax=Sphingomonas ginkgonis TaxID=2315330 RepID=A0A3R9Z681_9SPHN|nr:ribosome maturation factor RimM [Sphingomonas ginkgonis]RST30754.1 16S rRNA processing protein RimM [Sphingomonas ginkgonis]